jgi:hypothetical protein
VTVPSGPSSHVNRSRLQNQLQTATRQPTLTVDELPLLAPEDKAPEKGLLINIGPLEIDLTDARLALEQTYAILHSTAAALAQHPLSPNQKIGISIFIVPGGQAFRALSAGVLLEPDSTPPYILTHLYSNIHAFRALMETEPVS